MAVRQMLSAQTANCRLRFLNICPLPRNRRAGYHEAGRKTKEKSSMTKNAAFGAGVPHRGRDAAQPAHGAAKRSMEERAFDRRQG